jgi:hypothetical protein
MKMHLGITAVVFVSLLAGVAHAKEKEPTSKRVFLDKNGGGIEMRVNDPKDAEARDAVQQELRHAVQTEFSTPAMKEHQEEIQYRYEQTDRGGRLRIETKNPDALRAIQDYLRSQKNGGSTSKGVQFSFIRNTSLVSIPVLVNDRPFQFLLDTGASHTVLSAAVADRLRINVGRIDFLSSAGGDIRVTIRTIRLLQVGEALLKDAEVAVADFELLRTLGVDGILGGDYLRRFKVSIDYLKQLVKIELTTDSSSMLIA